MPVIKTENAPTFQLPGLTVTGLASPARGARETSAWRISIAPGTPGTPHFLDREEIFITLSGRAVATLEGEEIELRTGDTLIVPAGESFSLANRGALAYEAIALAPVGVRATLPQQGGSFAPPWTE